MPTCDKGTMRFSGSTFFFFSFSFLFFLNAFTPHPPLLHFVHRWVNYRCCRFTANCQLPTATVKMV